MSEGVQNLAERDRFSVAGKVIVVTGASSGIGRAIASALAAERGMVVAIARREAQLAAWSAAAEGETAYLAADLSDPEAAAEIAAKAAGPFGPPDILINAAGLNPRMPAEEQTHEAWNATLNISYRKTFNFYFC